MSEAQSQLPTEGFFALLGWTIPVHLNYHAILMVATWLVLVPLCIITIRFGKPKPTFNGIREKVSIGNLVWWWFSVHKYGLYLAIALSLVGLAVAVIASDGFSGSLHAMFGIATIVLGCLQVVSGWLRGTHGGRNYYTAVPDDPATWRGDHYDMTPRRRRFEAWHKTAGYFTGFFAVGAVASGLTQHPMPELMIVILVIAPVILVLCVLLEYKGLRYDGYRAAHGYNPEHPYNQARKEL